MLTKSQDLTDRIWVKQWCQVIIQFAVKKCLFYNYLGSYALHFLSFKLFEIKSPQKVAENFFQTVSNTVR